VLRESPEAPKKSVTKEELEIDIGYEKNPKFGENTNKKFNEIY